MSSSSAPPIVVLLTSAGSRAAEAIIACLHDVRAGLRLVGTNTLPAFASLAELDAAYLVPPTADEAAFTARLHAIIDIEKPDVIINCRDEEVALLSLIARQSGCIFLGPPHSITPVFADKYQTFQYCRERGLPFAPTACTASELATLLEQHGFPLIAKPRRGGHASKDVFLVATREQAARLLARGNVVFQPLLGHASERAAWCDEERRLGTPYIRNPASTFFLLDFVIGHTGQAVAACATRAEAAGSVFHRVDLLADPAWHALLHRHATVLAADGCRGPVNVQGCLDEDGQFCAFEWNARFVGSVDGYALLGTNLVLDALADLFPGRLSAPPPEPEACVVFRPMRFQAVPQRAIVQLADAGCYRRDSHSG